MPEKESSGRWEEKITKFAWITNITITKSNAKKIVKAGRNRWRTEDIKVELHRAVLN